MLSLLGSFALGVLVGTLALYHHPVAAIVLVCVFLPLINIERLIESRPGR